MRGYLSPTQRAHYQRGVDLFFSPEARQVASTLEGKELEARDLAVLDHLFGGWKHPVAMKRGDKYFLAKDDAIELPRGELLDAQIQEVKNAIAGQETIEGYRMLTPEDRALVADIISRRIGSGAINEVGRLGTTGRRYPTDYPDPELRGAPIPVRWEEGQQGERGNKLLLEVAEAVDPDTGAGLHGVPIDAMHRQPAAERPDLVSAVDNIKFGPKAMNQADGRGTDEELRSRRKSRLLNLQAQRFEEENGIRPSVGDDLVQNREGKQWDRLSKAIDGEVADIQSESGTMNQSRNTNKGASSGQNEKLVINNTGGGTVVLGAGIEDMINNKPGKTRMAGERLKGVA